MLQITKNHPFERLSLDFLAQLAKCLGINDCKQLVDKTYWASVYHIPKAVVNEIDKAMKSFLWSHGGSSNGRAKIAWKIVCRPKCQGGLAKVNDSWVWKKLLELRDSMKPHIFYKIGNGNNTSVWFDKWNQHGPLSKFITKKDIYDARFKESDTIADLIDEGIWL
ncbi:hypothetical protein Tco_1153577 [Tanacetum coccineum]